MQAREMSTSKDIFGDSSTSITGDDEGLSKTAENAEPPKEGADVSKFVTPMTMREARAAAHALKIFVQENQSIEAMRPYLAPIERFSREMDAVVASARMRQTTMIDSFQPVRSANGALPE